MSQELHLNFLSGAINGHFYWVYLVPISMCLGIIEKNTENITSTIGTYSTLKIALICLHNRKYYNFTPSHARIDKQLLADLSPNCTPTF